MTGKSNKPMRPEDSFDIHRGHTQDSYQYRFTKRAGHLRDTVEALQVWPDPKGHATTNNFVEVADHILNSCSLPQNPKYRIAPQKGL
jgi:hypothetical protein